MEQNKSNTISIEEQRAQGLLRQQAKYVPAARDRAMPVMPVNSQIAHVIDAAPVATQHVEMKTSAVDRALGFLIASVPLYAGFALLILLVTVFFYNVPFLSLPALVIFWLSFVAAWVIGYAYTLSVSAEGVSHYESRQKWDVIKEEQRRRWQHYERQYGIEPEQQSNNAWLLYAPLLLTVAVLVWIMWGERWN